MQDFALRVLPDSDPEKGQDESGRDLTDIKPLGKRSFPSDYLHVSNHRGTRTLPPDIEKLPELTLQDIENNDHRLQVWTSEIVNKCGLNLDSPPFTRYIEVDDELRSVNSTGPLKLD